MHEPDCLTRCGLCGPTEVGGYVADGVVKGFPRRVKVGGLSVAGCRLSWTLWFECVFSLQCATPLIFSAASVLQLPDHPHHFQASSASSSPSASRSSGFATEEDDGFFYSNQFSAAHITVHLMTPQTAVNRAGGRSTTRTLSRNSSRFLTIWPGRCDATPAFGRHRYLHPQFYWLQKVTKET